MDPGRVRSAPKQDPRTPPFCAGHLTTVLAVLAVCPGGLLSAVTALFAARALGTPAPSGLVFSPPPANALQIPWPLYALAGPRPGSGRPRQSPRPALARRSGHGR